MNVTDHVSLETLQKLARAEKNAKVARRIQIVILAIQGDAAPKIARSVGVSQRMCQLWVQRFNERGLDGLHDLPGRGRNPMLTPEQQKKIVKKRIDAGPTADDVVCTFRGEDLRRILEAEFGKVCSLGAVYYLLNQMGYASLSPRPQHRYADENSQQIFKKVP